MTNGRTTRSVGRAAFLMALLATLCGVTLVATGTPAQAGAGATAVHTRGGRVINVLADGDSYMAGNGSAGDTYLVSPDDPHTPPAPYSGSGCWRKFNNASRQMFDALGSTGWYINRACSGRLTSDVVPEVADLVGTAYADQTDLITYSAGGNDAAFADIAVHCILLPGNDASTVYVGGKWISRNCYNLLTWLKTQIDKIIGSEQQNLNDLLGKFPNAKIVMDGYPMLVDKVTSAGVNDTHHNTINYAYSVLSSVLPNITNRQRTMVASVSAANGGRVAFNDVFARFGSVAHNHGVYSSDPWLYGLRPNTLSSESLHPNPTGQHNISLGMVAQVNAKGWFGGFPTVSGAAVPTFNFIPGNGVENGAQQLTDANGNVYNTVGSVPSLSCHNQTLTFSGWWGRSRHVLELNHGGPDTIRVRCEYPRAGDIVFRGSASYLVGGSSSNNYGFTLQSIPTGWMYNCLAGGNVRKYTISQGLLAVKGVAGTVPGRTNCVPNDWRFEVLVGPNGAAYFVDGGGVRHWVQSTQTFYSLTHTYGAAIRLDHQVDIDTIPEGGWQPEELWPQTHLNTLIVRNDGVMWAVDSSGVRHHVPTYLANVCWRWVNGWHVSESNLSGALAASLPEGDAWDCNLNGTILATNEGAAYLIDGNQRHWIQDPESFYAYAEGRRVVRGISMAEVRPISEGGWMPRKLSPNRIKNHVVRVSDGTAYFVDGSGLWHWIPNGGIWGCIVAKHSVIISDASWDEVNALKHEGGWAACGM